MSSYADLARIEALHKEQAEIDRALTILDDHNGTVASYTVAALAQPADGQMAPMGVSIVTVDPGQSLVAGVRSSLVQRYNVINQELRDLGVTDGPPDHAGGGPPQEE